MPNSLPTSDSFKELKKQFEKIFPLLDAAERRSDNKELTYLLVSLDKIFQSLMIGFQQLEVSADEKADLKVLYDILKNMPSKWSLEQKLAFLKTAGKLSLQQSDEKKEEKDPPSWMGSYEEYNQKYGYKTGTEPF